MYEQRAPYRLKLIAVTFLILKLFILIIANPEDFPYLMM